MSYCKTLPEAVIFDMDGVLVDSNPFHVKKWTDFLNARGIPHDPQDIARRFIGIRNEIFLRTFLGSGPSEEEIQRLSDELQVSFRRDFCPRANPQPGVLPLLEELREHGIPMAVASAARGEDVHALIEAMGLRSYFHRVVTGDEVVRHKPDPEIYLKAASALNVSPGNCVALEDSAAGLESARRAGMKCVVVLSNPGENGFSEAADLTVGRLEVLTFNRLRSLFMEYNQAF